MDLILAIDQGTTSTRAIVFNKQGQVIEQSQREITCLYPTSGWVEQDANEIWISTLSVLNSVLLSPKIDVQDIKGIGITNQRETTILWDKKQGAHFIMQLSGNRDRQNPFVKTGKLKG